MGDMRNCEEGAKQSAVELVSLKWYEILLTKYFCRKQNNNSKDAREVFIFRCAGLSWERDVLYRDWVWDVSTHFPFREWEESEVYLKTQSVPRSKHSVSVIKTSQFILYREIIAVCSEIHTKHINTVCGQKVEFFNVKPGGAYSNHLKVK